MTKKTPIEMFDTIQAELPTNGADAITAAILRGVLQDIADSFFQKQVIPVTVTPFTWLNSHIFDLLLVNRAPATAVSIAAPQTGGEFMPGWSSQIRNQGAGTVTITPTGGQINGAANLALTTGKSAQLFTDGTNYWAVVAGP